MFHGSSEAACTPGLLGIVEDFESLPDARSSVNWRHRLEKVVAISVCGVLAEVGGLVVLGEWANVFKDLLKKFLTLPHGCPSQDVTGAY